MELRLGFSTWLRAVQILVTLPGAAAILASPTGGVIKGCCLVALVFSAMVVHAVSMRKSRSGFITLFHDGTAQIRTDNGQVAQVMPGTNGWVTRWLSVLVLIESGRVRRHRCVVCASGNDPHAYRRMLKYFTMSSSATILQKAAW